MYVGSLKGERGEAQKNLVFSSKWMTQNCLLAYISMKLRENLSTPTFLDQHPPFSFLPPFYRNFRNLPFQPILGNSNPLYKGEGSELCRLWNWGKFACCGMIYKKNKCIICCKSPQGFHEIDGGAVDKIELQFLKSKLDRVLF